MANLKEIRSRISSVGSTMQITNAMKMVSAAKLKRAQDSIVQLRPYADKLRDILQNISSTLDSNVGGELTVQREVQKLLLVVLTSNRGLAGAFNSSIVKKTNSIIEEAKQKGNKEERVNKLNEIMTSIKDEIKPMLPEMNVSEKSVVRNGLQTIQNMVM